MFWKSNDKPKRKRSAMDDKARVELIRERLSDYVSTGEKTQFEIDVDGPTDLDNDGSYEFKVVNAATVNYGVTEFGDLTEADTDVRTALTKLANEPTTFNDDISETDLSKTDYWSTKS